MQQDLSYPTKCRDMTLLRESLQRFEKAMQRTMLVMKEMRNALEEVSVAFQGLTSLSCCGDGAKATMRRFVAEMRELKDGPTFLQYNKRVHEDVVEPVKQLCARLTDAESRARQRDEALRQYEALRREVARKEEKYARRHKSLAESKTYTKKTDLREAKLKVCAAMTAAFNQSFERLLLQTATVTEATMRRYIYLNAAFLVAVVYAFHRAATSAELRPAQQLPSVPSDTHLAAAMGASAPAEGGMTARASPLAATERAAAALQPTRQAASPACTAHPAFLSAPSTVAAPRYSDASRSGSVLQVPGVDDAHGASGRPPVDLSPSRPRAPASEAPVNGAEDAEAMRPEFYSMDHLRMERGTAGNVSGLPIPLLWRSQDF
ncbi:uncharacterized protein Tco025E_04443 [Trypanosoma conorhini]|uniref:BAR domain-containing protein n=1 Tax=Trypanosoma conorhini TaxID=83891 RepID=A0A3R7MPH2_9TRYP|nr:uncharacterized protein Tco025E_04443 [Trypanosoma conorhini]RNF18546.1 hypothetical protein Tco025E_04443 [Trypanosoma conorhini]